jgi:uncharacterized ion transporter superfamily protein YfcC
MNNFFSLNHKIGNRILFLLFSIFVSVMWCWIVPIWFDNWVYYVFFGCVIVINVVYSMILRDLVKDIDNG